MFCEKFSCDYWEWDPVCVLVSHFLVVSNVGLYTIPFHCVKSLWVQYESCVTICATHRVTTCAVHTGHVPAMTPILGAFDLKLGYRWQSTWVAACSRRWSWKQTCQARHIHLPLVTLTWCLHTLSQMKWIKCCICQIHRRFRNVFMSNRNSFYILLKTAPYFQE